MYENQNASSQLYEIGVKLFCHENNCNSFKLKIYFGFITFSVFELSSTVTLKV